MNLNKVVFVAFSNLKDLEHDLETMQVIDRH